MKALLSAVMIGALVTMGVFRAAEAQDAPLFVAGQRLFLVYDCLPQWAAELMSQANQGRGFNPCYTEDQVTVLVDWKNGWLTVEDANRQRWNVNTARILAYQVVDAQQAAR